MHLGHEHLDEALLEVAHLGPHVLVDRAAAGRVLRGGDHAVAGDEAAARGQRQVRRLPAGDREVPRAPRA